ncbi:MAG: hypothetical protein ACJ8EH_10485 [Sphingomicrobium sp.]|jgi:hypothetical protein
MATLDPNHAEGTDLLPLPAVHPEAMNETCDEKGGGNRREAKKVETRNLQPCQKDKNGACPI